MTTLFREEDKTAEDRAWDLQCYGMSEGSLRNIIKNDITVQMTGNYVMLAASFMSNAQEEIEHGMTERARQTINCAKFILFNFVMKETA
jgi:hypothetical protein